ncbi:hypothetical protein AMELA_G00009500, partial [Ameiurus melas]
MSFRGGGGRGGRGGGGFGRGGFGGRGGGRGGFNRQQDYGPPEYVVALGEFMHPCEDDIVCKCVTEENKVPYFNAPVYLENKEQIGKVDEIFGQLRDFYFSVKLSENMKASSFKKLQKFYVDPAKLLPLQRFLPRPPGEKGPPRGGRGGGGRGGGFRGGRGGGGGRRWWIRWRKRRRVQGRKRRRVQRRKRRRRRRSWIQRWKMMKIGALTLLLPQRKRSHQMIGFLTLPTAGSSIRRILKFFYYYYFHFNVCIFSVVGCRVDLGVFCLCRLNQESVTRSSS